MEKTNILIVELENNIQVSLDYGEFVTIPKNNGTIWMLNVIKNPNNYNVNIVNTNKDK